MSESVFLDTNVILRLLLGDILDQQSAAARFVASIAAGETVAVLSDTVEFERDYVLRPPSRRASSGSSPPDAPPATISPPRELRRTALLR